MYDNVINNKFDEILINYMLKNLKCVQSYVFVLVKTVTLNYLQFMINAKYYNFLFIRLR